MFKKHLIPLVAILVMLLMVKVFAYTRPAVKTSLGEDEKINIIQKAEELKPKHEEQLAFAEETLPIGDEKVSKKMKKALAAFSYQKLQTNRLHEKAGKWFPIIEPILEAYGIPNDFKYLPLVESGLLDGVSPKGAAGYWQFMPGTARTYGLKVNGQVDERYNLRKSTIAACKYLNELYDVFESWTLVAAAYNVGDTHMRKQIRKQKQDNYFKMKLNRETASYVYKLISMKEILENPAVYGYKNQRPFIAYNVENVNANTSVE